MMRRGSLGIALWFVGAAVQAQEQNLWEWMNVAPVVAVVVVQQEDPKQPLARVDRVFRGDLREGDIVAIDLRKANRERPGGVGSLELLADSPYLALLDSSSRKRESVGKPQLFRLIRGVEGVRELPAEGIQAWIEAAERISEIGTLGNDVLVWEALGDLLAARNPILVRTALEAHVAFVRGGPELFASVLPLLSHPSPKVRQDAAALAGICIRRGRSEASRGEGRELVLQLIGSARRDAAPEVRAGAVRALGVLADESIQRVLEEVAESDPEQNVRYEAERILFESTGGGPSRPD